MKNILYNFTVTLKRFKTASVLNLLGLSVAFTIFIIVLSQLWWQYTYNDSIPQSEKIHLFASEYNKGEGYAIHTSRPYGDQIAQSIAGIESYAIRSERYNIYKEIGDAKNVTERSFKISPSFIEMMGIEIVEGDISRFNEPNAVIISHSMAQKYFGDKSPIGAIIESVPLFDTSVNPPVTTHNIVAIYKDLPSNSMVGNGVYTNVGDFLIGEKGYFAFEYFYKFSGGENIEKQIQEKFNELNPSHIAGEQRSVKLIPMDEIYFSPYLKNTYGVRTGNLTLTLALISVAIVILLIAVVNYINFFMSLVPVRIKAVNIAKVFGASTRALKANIIFEGVGIMALAFGFSLLLVGVVADWEFIRFSGEAFLFKNNILVLVAVGLFAIVLGAISGLFPAWYITKFSPSMILAGSFGRSRRGRGLRTVLSTFQFSSSIVLVVVSLFIILQNSFMSNYDYGYKRDRLYKLGINPNGTEKSLASELLLNPDILEVAYMNGTLAAERVVTNMRTSFDDGGDYSFTQLSVDWNYPQMMGFELIEGRYFSEEDLSSTGSTMIFNETAAKKFNIKAGDRLSKKYVHSPQVVGVVKDFQYGSLHNSIPPICLTLMPKNDRGFYNADIRISSTADIEKTLTFIRTTLCKVDPSINPEQVRLVDFNQSIDQLYKKEQMLSTIIMAFSFISILISLLGVMGTVIFDLQHRRKEVSVRKVFGATVGSILGRFNRGVLWILIISTLIGLPIAWYIISTWLENFTRRVPMHWWVFAAGVVIVAVIVFSLVILQTWRTANANPTKFLKSE